MQSCAMLLLEIVCPLQQPQCVCVCIYSEYDVIVVSDIPLAGLVSLCKLTLP